jgi:hypothetical protein
MKPILSEKYFCGLNGRADLHVLQLWKLQHMLYIEPNTDHTDRLTNMKMEITALQ